MQDDWDLPPLLTRLYQQRGVRTKAQLCLALSTLLPFNSLRHIDTAAQLLGEAIRQQQRILIMGDFDADGATSTALAVAALTKFGAQSVDYLIPNRFTSGYGLTPALIEIAQQRHAQFIITVDNGMTSHAGVAHAKALGMQILITDHHLAADTLPNADAIVNPNQPDDLFPSKNLAGVGVIFYVLLAVRQYLRKAKWFGANIPAMAEFLDLVALGTVADVVPLDHNNRILVQQGLQRIRAGKARPGIKALLQVAKRNTTHLSATDLAFSVAPRLNAAGRLEEMSQGVACLLADNATQALVLATQLDSLNQERRAIEALMVDEAQTLMQTITLDALPAGICLYQPNWHQGVIGILAGRLKNTHYRPTLIFANDSQADLLKGSARSIPALHMRDLLAAIDREHPRLIQKFGGHAMAAGLTLKRVDFLRFKAIYTQMVNSQLTAAELTPDLAVDGELVAEELSLTSALMIREGGPWGQHFAEPLFIGHFTLLEQTVYGNNHQRLRLLPRHGKAAIEAMWFNCTEPLLPTMQLVYRLTVDEFDQKQQLKLVIEKKIKPLHCTEVLL